MNTLALKEALDKYKFDAAIGGSRRDEEKSRAKERLFSVRESGHRWDPRQQRAELWRTYNPRILPDQTMRVFPISDWTELDIWSYIHHENIYVNPLYFAKERPVVKRGTQWIMVDDERYPLRDGDVLAVGDGRNDIEMLQWAGRHGVSVAMGQASEIVREAAREVTGSIDEGGLMSILDREFMAIR
jgi:3'-phosphoadenosine 5'-phosphosulfate sulfotransferase (PAPS reductase)/FAD synthetase